MSSSVSSESIQGATTTTTTTTASRQPKQQHNPQHQQATTMQQLYPASGLLALAAAAATGGGETTGFTLSPHVPLPVPQAVSAQPGSIPHHQVLMHQQQFLFPDRFSILQNDDNGKLSIPYLLNQAAASRMHNQFQAAPAGLPFPGRGWLPPSSNENNDTGRPTGPFPFAIPMLQPRHPSSSSSGPLRVVGAPQVAQPNGAETASVGKSQQQQQQQAGTTIASSNASSSSRYSPAARRPSDSWSSGASSPNPNAKRGQSPGLSSGGAPSDDDDGDYIDDSESEDGKANLRHKSGLSPIGPIKKKRASQHQVSVLEQFFATDPLPTSGSQRALAEALGMTQRSVQLWFQNKRAKLRRMGKTITPKQKGITFHHFSVANNGKLRMVNEEGSADLHGIL